jgi:hypothetical protein
MNTKLPLLITLCIGLIILIAEFIPVKPFSSIQSELEMWFMIIAAFAIILGQLSLLKMNIIKIQRKITNWQYSIVTIVSFAVMFLVGMAWGMQNQTGLLGHGDFLSRMLGAKPFDYIFNNIYQHLMAATFSLLAFFIASAAYRAFIARTFESTLLLAAAIIVMLGNTSIGSSMTAALPDYLHLPNISSFVMEFPNTAGQRAIMIGAGLGIIGSSLRIILGLERSWLGGSK